MQADSRYLLRYYAPIPAGLAHSACFWQATAVVAVLIPAGLASFCGTDSKAKGHSGVLRRQAHFPGSNTHLLWPRQVSGHSYHSGLGPVSQLCVGRHHCCLEGEVETWCSEATVTGEALLWGPNHQGMGWQVRKV